MKHNDRLVQTKSQRFPLFHQNRIRSLLPQSLSTQRREDTHLVALALTQHIAVLLDRAAGELGLLPQVRGEEAVGVGDGDEGGLERVLERLGRTGGGGVGVVHTSQLQEALDGGRGDETGTTGGWDELAHAVSMIHH